MQFPDVPENHDFQRLRPWAIDWVVAAQTATSRLAQPVADAEVAEPGQRDLSIVQAGGVASLIVPLSNSDVRVDAATP